MMTPMREDMLGAVRRRGGRDDAMRRKRTSLYLEDDGNRFVRAGWRRVCGNRLRDKQTK